MQMLTIQYLSTQHYMNLLIVLNMYKILYALIWIFILFFVLATVYSDVRC